MYKPMPRSRKRKIRIFHIYFIVLTLILALALTGMLAQTAFAKTYVITDGDRVVTCTSFATDPARVLGQAGVELNRFDSFTTKSDGAVDSITVRRAANVTIHYRGEIIETTSNDETAGELLDRLELDVSGEDELSHGLDTRIYEGMELRVDRMVTAEETYSAVIPREVIRQEDPSVPRGTEWIIAFGEDGEKLCTAQVTYVNGEETQRLVLTQQVTRMPTAKIVGVGTGEEAAAVDPYAPPVIGDGYILLPTGEMLTYTRVDTVLATAYTHTDTGCDLLTATGSTVHRGTVAVDPRYIPYGTRMFIMASDGSYVYGIAAAEDCGGDIRRDRMDLYLPSYEACMEFGRRRCSVYFLG